MFRKLKGNLIMMQLAFLIVVVGGSALVYSLFAPDYYIGQKSKLIKAAYEELQAADLSNLDNEDVAMLKSYQEDNLIFIITDQEFKPVYITRDKSKEHQIEKNIKRQINQFSEAPQIMRKNTKTMGVVRLSGMIQQDEKSYYVCIKEEIKSAYSSFKYTSNFLIIVIIVSLAIGSVIMYILSGRISKPIEQIEEVARKVAKRDFTTKAETKSSFVEIESLAENINRMSDQIQNYLLHLETDKDRLMEQNQQQEKMDDVRKEFMANISHELKTPLTVISSQVEMLQCMGNEIDRDYYYDSIVEEVTKMSEMIGNMLNLTVVEHHMDTMQQGKVNLSDMMEYLMLKYDALFRQHHIQCETQIKPSGMVMGNKSYLEQAISNYLLNAFHHSMQGGSVEISLERVESNMVIKVYNEGTQIKEAEMEKIWKSFYRREESDVQNDYLNGSNVGLGLHIVRTIVGLHHGDCGVRNRNKGVEFWIQIPAID